MLSGVVNADPKVLIAAFFWTDATEALCVVVGRRRPTDFVMSWGRHNGVSVTGHNGKRARGMSEVGGVGTWHRQLILSPPEQAGTHPFVSSDLCQLSCWCGSKKTLWLSQGLLRGKGKIFFLSLPKPPDPPHPPILCRAAQLNYIEGKSISLGPKLF